MEKIHYALGRNEVVTLNKKAELNVLEREDMIMNKMLSENILKLRKEKGLTQEKLAALLQVSFQAVSRWENGQAYPDMELLPQLASIFQVSIDSLLGYQVEKMNSTHYERKYQDRNLYWGTEINSICYEVMKLMPPTRPLKLLDIGCGEGQTAVFLLEMDI